MLIVLVMTAVLAAMGRQFWCSCSSPIPWSWDIWTQHNSQHLLDPYFFTHVLHGVIFFWILSAVQRSQIGPLSQTTKWSIAITAEAIWEVFENSTLIINRYRESTMALGYTGDSIANSIFDVVACAIGYYAASKLNWKISLAIVALTELVMLVAIRDTLLLNIIMLIHPFDVIKEWQLQISGTI